MSEKSWNLEDGRLAATTRQAGNSLAHEKQILNIPNIPYPLKHETTFTRKSFKAQN